MAKGSKSITVYPDIEGVLMTHSCSCIRMHSQFSDCYIFALHLSPVEGMGPGKCNSIHTCTHTYIYIYPGHIST